MGRAATFAARVAEPRVVARVVARASRRLGRVRGEGGGRLADSPRRLARLGADDEADRARRARGRLAPFAALADPEPAAYNGDPECATPTLVPATPASPPHPSLSRSRSAARRRSPQPFPPPRRLAILGEEVRGEGVVTRRHTLGRKLTFVDITVSGPGRVRDPSARPSSRDDARVDDEHFVFVKAWGAVPKRARVGARVRFAGRLLRPREERPRDIEAAAVRPGSYHASVPEGHIEVTVPAAAADVPNARAFLKAEADDVRSTSARTGPVTANRTGPISANRTGPITATRKNGTSVARLCKSFVVNGACGDPNCAKRHDATRGSWPPSPRVAATRVVGRGRGGTQFDPDDPHARRRARPNNSAIESSRIGWCARSVWSQRRPGRRGGGGVAGPNRDATDRGGTTATRRRSSRRAGLSRRVGARWRISRAGEELVVRASRPARIAVRPRGPATGVAVASAEKRVAQSAKASRRRGRGNARGTRTRARAVGARRGRGGDATTSTPRARVGQHRRGRRRVDRRAEPPEPASPENAPPGNLDGSNTSRRSFGGT